MMFCRPGWAQGVPNSLGAGQVYAAMKDKTLAYLMQAGELLTEKPRFPSKRKCQEPKLIPVLQFVNLSWEQEQTVGHPVAYSPYTCFGIHWVLDANRSVLNAKMKFFSAQSGTCSASEFEQFSAESGSHLASLGIICCVGDSSHRGSRASCYPGVRAQVMSKSISVSGSPRVQGVYMLYTRL